MPVGNDVVDLLDPENQPGALHPRWDTRVFTEAEQRRVDDAPSRHRQRWAMWAAKESAFKAASRIDPSVRFIPTAFVVEFSEQHFARVRHPAGIFDIRLSGFTDHVHAVATGAAAAAPSSSVEVMTRPQTPASSSQQVRKLARREIANALGLDPAAVEIVGRGRVPLAQSRGVELPVHLSLSHHGRFMACAWVLRP